MTEETTQRIREACPKLRLPAQFQCHDGWEDVLCTALKLLPKGISIFEVKEKYGELRIHHGGADAVPSDLHFASGVVAMAESVSQQVCEMCGERGRSGRCDTHREK